MREFFFGGHLCSSRIPIESLLNVVSPSSITPPQWHPLLVDFSLKQKQPMNHPRRSGSKFFRFLGHWLKLGQHSYLVCEDHQRQRFGAGGC